MTIKQILAYGIKQLKESDFAELDAELLLAFVIKKSREFLFSHGEKEITNRQVIVYKQYIMRRVKQEPIVYITGNKEFYGLDFIVNKDVLIPRPDTETLIEAVLPHVKNQAVVDVGTGSGAIVIALAKNSNGKFFAIDASIKALKIAKKNAKINKVSGRIKFIKGNLIEPLINELFKTGLIIVANLPYIPSSELKELQKDVIKYEPKMALDGGKDGLKYYRELFNQIGQLGNIKIKVFCEIDPKQVKSFEKILNMKVRVFKDLAGRDRVVNFNLN